MECIGTPIKWRSQMTCPKCKQEMDNIGCVHRWNEQIWYCSECDFEVPEDITGELIDHAMDMREER